ncbi:MAG: hypothetical protein IH600_02415 [Bacteroidetes bacterium]|nr:hypothetical protein [Bacteroidota bacterium]
MNEFPITEFNATSADSDDVLIYLVSGQSIRAHNLKVEKDSLSCVDANSKMWQMPLSGIDRLEENSSAIGCIFGTGYGVLAFCAILAISTLTGFIESVPSESNGGEAGVAVTISLALAALFLSSIAGGLIGQTVEYRVEAK